MALGASVSDGFRKMTVDISVLAGGVPDIQSVKIQPILRPYTVFATARVVTAAGDVLDFDIMWQAVPRTEGNEQQGARIGIEPGAV